MLTIRIRVKAVDHDGFNGRDNPPADSDIGVEGTITNLELVPDDDVDDPDKDNPFYQIIYARLDNERNVELMGHEIQLLGATHDGDL